MSTVPATILVLEENAAVQELIDQALRDSGHRTLGTKNSLEALDVVRTVRIDVLVVGALLDEQRETVVDELRSMQPSLEVVSICGLDDDLSNVEHSARLSKPLSLEALRAAVAARLEHPGH